VWWLNSCRDGGFVSFTSASLLAESDAWDPHAPTGERCLYFSFGALRRHEIVPLIAGEGDHVFLVAVQFVYFYLLSLETKCTVAFI
jgi:hypothetical protein